jgi:diguanylate cyclase (GGDEF)-like protein
LQANFPQVFVKALKSPETGLAEPVRGNPRLSAVLGVAEAMGDFLEFGSRNPELSERWLDRLKDRLHHLQGADPNSSLPTQSFIDTVRQHLEEWFPVNVATDSETRVLCQANRELGRLAWRTSLAHGQAQTRAQQAEQSLKQYERKIYSLERQALRDPLTGVYNRRFLLEALQKEVARCCRYAAPIGLLFVDVDAFKPLNDRWGHLVGDQILRRVAETLQGVLRSSDILARYGGEEFVVLPNDPNETGIQQLAERLRQAVEQLVTKVDSARLQVTISVGCTLTVPTRDDLDLGPQLLASADAAMYDAKQLGRNKVVFRSLLDESERELMQRTIDCTFTRWLVSRNFLSSQAVESLLSDYSPDRLPLGELAIDTGLLTDGQVLEILELQVESGDRFGALAHQRELLSLSQLAMLLARQRENPIQLARLLIGKHLFEEAKALSLVKDYLASLK